MGLWEGFRESEDLFVALGGSACNLLDQFSAQHLANVTWAYATVQYLDASLFDRIAVNACGRLAEFQQKELASIAWAFASVGLSCQGGASFNLVEAAISRFASPGMLQDCGAQEVANLTWASGITGCHNESFFRHATERLVELDSAVLAPHFAQWHTAWLARSTKEDQVPSFVSEDWLNRCQEAAMRYFRAAPSSGAHLRSSLHMEVCMEIQQLMQRSLNAKVDVEYALPEGLVVDIAVLGPVKVAIEVDGPSHFVRLLQPSEQTAYLKDRLIENGSTKFKRRMLQHLGWKARSVPWFEWSRLSNRTARAAFLQDLLK